MLKRWRQCAKIFGAGLITIIFLSPSALAINASTYNILANPFYDPTGATDCGEVTPPDNSGNVNPPSQIDLGQIAQQDNLQSAIVKKFGGNVVGTYHADQPPKALASVFKLIIADVFLSQKPNLDRKVTVTKNELYSGKGGGSPEDPQAGQQINLKTALQMTLMKSSNTDANVLIDAAGGIDNANKLAGQLGYNSTTFKSLYTYRDVQPGYAGNISTVTDLSKALENIFSSTDPNYVVAQESLKNDTYTFGLGSIANKWGGTSAVTANSGLFEVGGDRYVITMYTENPWSDSIPAEGITEQTSASVGYIKDATNTILNQLKGAASPQTQPAGTLSSCQSACGAGTSASLDRFLQVVAYHESRGDYLASNTAGGVSGRYQYTDSTWQGAAKSYFLPAVQYSRSSDAPGDVQDSVTYLRFAAMDVHFSGSVFKMAVDQYLPAANSDPSLLDKVPAAYAGNTFTPRQYANLIISDVNSGKYSDVQLHYKDSPQFAQYLKKDGLENIPQVVAAQNDGSGGQPVVSSGNDNTNGFACAGSSSIVQTAISFSWPDSSHGTTPDPAYKAYLDAHEPGYPAADCGVFVGAVMHASGADPNYPNSGTSIQAKYVLGSSKYQVDSNVKSTSELQPGDILILGGTTGDAASGHTFIWLGNVHVNGISANEASASFQQRAANLGTMTSLADPRGTYIRARLVK